MSESLHPILEPVNIGPLKLRNRIVKAATYETMTKDGLVTDELIGWHENLAAGGVAVTTLAYCSVSADGRTFGDQIWMREQALSGLSRLTAAVHDNGALAAIQLGHAGWFAEPKASGSRPLGPSRQFSPHARTFSRAMTEDDLERIVDDFRQAALWAIESGFDAIEVHVGHGYLLSQFLSPFNNRRRDRWGQDRDGRASFPRRVLKEVRQAVGNSAAVWIKLNVDDGFRGGLTIEDSLAFARGLEADALVDAIQLSGGHTTRSPMYLMRGDSPMVEILAHNGSVLRRAVVKAIAPLFVKNYPFEEAWFRPAALKFRENVNLPLMLLGGVTRADTMATARRDGFELVALGRALVAEPDLALRLANQAWSRSKCTHCNMCVAAVGKKAVRCVL